MYDPVQYFDEMNILKDDKLRRINTAKEFINALVDFFTAQFMNLLSGIFLYEKSSSDYENELMDLYFANMKHLPHDGRHTFASLMDDAGANEVCIKLIMGHSMKNNVTKGVYTHKTTQQLIDEVNKI